LVVLTGVSGSGKSTLAFDVIFAEGQRRYLESLTPYARQYIKVLERPEIDLASGLPPTVAIQQRVRHGGKRSTVATLTEIYHFLRLLYSKLGVQHCPICGMEMSSQSEGEIIKKIRKKYGRKKAIIIVPLIAGRKGIFRDLFTRLISQGFEYIKIDGEIRQLTQGISLSRYQEHNIELVLGHIANHDLDQLVMKALYKGRGTFMVIDDENREEVFSLDKVCPNCGVSAKELDPRLFSFNSKHGACPACQGLGYTGSVEENSLTVCHKCRGSRLKREALSVKIHGYSIWDLVQNPAKELVKILKQF
jgi:excinuclease ABC subunit A